jgi:DNA (cytosine-5)-methyltransferase 1
MFDAPDYLRRLTLKEATAIHTFSKTYKFAGGKSSIYSQIGNAVPCNLAYAVARAVNDVLEHRDPVQEDAGQLPFRFATVG